MYYIDKIKFHLSNWWYFLKEHLVGTLFFFSLIFFFTSSIFKLKIVNTYDEEKRFIQQTIFIADITLDNWFTWFSIVSIGCGLIWTLYQYNKKQKGKQQEKASEIAKDFANNFVEKLGLISDTLMQNNTIQELVTSVVKSQQLNQFTSMEIIKILKNTECFTQYNEIIFSEETQKNYERSLNERYNKKEQERFDSYFPLLIENTLNHLEAVCINISSQAAGSQFIYNSLHQSFLYNIEVLSIKISSNNTNNVDKYYTHIIQVYNMWNKQKKRDIIKLEKTQKKIDRLNSKAEKEITKLLTKKNETV